MEPHDLDDFPPIVGEIINILVSTVDEVDGVDRSSICIEVDDDDDIGVAYLTTDCDDYVLRVVFTTDGSRRAWVIPDDDAF